MAWTLSIDSWDGPRQSFHSGTTRPFTYEGCGIAWFQLLLAGILEGVWALFMKKSKGFTLLVPSIITIGTMIASFVLLSLTMRSLPLGSDYTVWTGIGAVGAFAVGVIVLGEVIPPLRLIAAFLIVAGILLMRFRALPYRMKSRRHPMPHHSQWALCVRLCRSIAVSAAQGWKSRPLGPQRCSATCLDATSWHSH